MTRLVWFPYFKRGGASMNGESQEIMVTYDGPAITDGAMNVRDFASSVLALADAYQEAARVLWPERSEPPLIEIRATQPGSFDVILALMDPGGIMSILAGSHATAAVNGVTLAGLVPKALELLKRAAGRPISQISEQDEQGNIDVRIGDNNSGTTVNISNSTINLIDSPRFRKAASDIVRPVDGEHINELTVASGGQTVELHTEDSVFIQNPAPLEIVRSDTTVWLEILTPQIGTPEKAWRFREDQAAEYSAQITDESFLERVEDGLIEFSRGSRIKCQMTTDQTVDARGQRSKRTITEVLAFQQSPASQLTIFRDAHDA